MAEDDQLSNDLASLRIDRSQQSASASSGSGSKSRGWLWALLVLAALGAGGYAVFHSQKERIFAPEVELTQVALISPSQADVTLVATGYVVSRKKATLAARAQGRLLHLYVGEGDKVKEGQLLAEIDRADVDALLAQARADAASARAKVEEARAGEVDAQVKAAREKELLARGAGTQASSDDAAARLQTTRAQLASAQANVTAIETRIRTAGVNLDYTKVRAPFDGTVLRKLAEVGDMVGPVAGNTGNGILLLASLTELEVEADVSETQLSKVALAAAKPVADGGVESGPRPIALRGSNAPAEIVLDAFPDRRFRGVVADVRPTVDRAKATVTVKVRFVDPTEGVLPDMSAKVSFLSKPIDQSALSQAPKRVVPPDAIVEREGRKVVFTVENGQVKAAPVVVKGTLASGGVELSDGPPAGTSIIKAPRPELHDGSRVKTEK